jgi:hypothetical protein
LGGLTPPPGHRREVARRRLEPLQELVREIATYSRLEEGAKVWMEGTSSWGFNAASDGARALDSQAWTVRGLTRTRCFSGQASGPRQLVPNALWATKPVQAEGARLAVTV